MLQMGRKHKKNLSKGNKCQHRSCRDFAWDNTGVPFIKRFDIEITDECLEMLNAKRQFDKNEDCGILFGSQISDERIRINSISDSCCDKTSALKCSCHLDVEKANKLIAEEFHKSNQTRVYIGEWHTHPEDYPSPSIQDLKSLKESYNKNQLAIPHFILMAIIGRKSICFKMYDGHDFSSIKPCITSNNKLIPHETNRARK